MTFGKTTSHRRRAMPSSLEINHAKSHLHDRRFQFCDCVDKSQSAQE